MRPSGPEIRPATEADIPEWIRIEGVSLTAPQWNVQQLHELLASGGETNALRRIVLAAELAGEVIGLAVVSAICSVDPAEAELEGITVAPKARGQGTGRTLLQTSLAWAANQGADAMRLEVRAGNQAALRLYQASGFVRTGTRANYYADPQEDAVCMQVSLLPGLK